MKKSTFKGLVAGLALSLFSISSVQAQAFTEGFNDITLLAGNGWVMTNASVAVGSTSWFQGNPVSGGGPFDAYNGATNAYIGANYNNTGSTGTISNWLMTPNRTFRNGDVITFFTRKPAPDTYADRLEVRLSTNGASTNVGSGSAVGDYTTLLMSVNPSLVLGVYPTTWTMYTITISGLPAPTSGRIGFRYFVTGAGLNGSNSDYIGIDQVVYTPYVCPTFTMTASGALTGGAAGSAYNTTLTQTGALGAPSFAVTAGALPPGLTMSTSGTISGTPMATGTFNFTTTVSDASGCSGSSSYSITVVCPANPTTLNGLPALCDNGTPVTLTQGSPAGGTYSGTGVTGGMFDPAAGTQTITYDYTDPYGCPHQTSNTITVNTAPSVTQDPIGAVCDNSGMLALTGGTPAGGTYSGTGVTGSDFDPSMGTQTVTYTYTDANACTNSATASITVNTAPAVTQDPIADACENGGLVPLAGGLPAGGTYSGTGVTGSDFDPSVGTQTVTYSYTDGNGCTNDADVTINVNTPPAVTQDPFTAVCEDASDVTLAGGLPAGGSYSGTGVTAGMFDPSSGTQTITYMYTDANGCSNSIDEDFTVNSLPVVALTLTVDELCVYNSSITLAGASPAGGTFSGTGVTGSNFDPATAGLGSHTITYMYTDVNGCMNSDTDAMDVDACLSISEADKTVISVFPNPGSGLFEVTGLTGTSVVNIVDAQGRAIDFNMVSISNSQVSIDISTMPNGIYLMNVDNTMIRLVKN